MSGDFAALVDDALALVATGIPVLHQAIDATLGEVVVGMQVGEESLAVTGTRVVDHPATDPPVRFVATPATVLDIAEGRSSLCDTVLDGRVALTGELRAVATADAALRLFVHGVVRIPEASALQRRLRAICQEDQQ